MSLLSNAIAIPQKGGYNLTDSVRMRGNQTGGAYLTRTPSSTSNRRTWTQSFWIKRARLDANQYFGMNTRYTDTTNRQVTLMFLANNTFWFTLIDGGTYIADINTARVFRDISAWYHIVVAVDTTQATSTNRVKIYVNGVQETALQGYAGSLTYPSLNFDTAFNNTYPHNINEDDNSGGTNNCDCYYTEFNFVDGQQLTASDFGAYDATTGVWKPKKYTGTYGTNGFYLPMNQETELYSAEYLIVAGGGGGAWGNGGPGGGGGAGGLLAGSTDIFSGTVYNITVGTGGAGSASPYGNNAKGTNSTALGLTAIGGGNGRWNTTYVTGNGSGGSGGGAGAGGAATPIGTGTAGQGNNGGNQSTSSADNGGGGGGKGSVGGNAIANTSAGNGGTGYASSITGTSLYYAGGGGGGGQSAGGTGGSGVGGNGGKQSVSNATSPTANTGSGGGGGMGATAGADGVVILRVLTSNYSGTTTGSPTVTTDGSYTVMKFTSNGSYTA